MFERVRHMLVKEFLQILRDPRMRIVVFLMPLVQTIVIGYAVTLDVENIRLAVYDQDRTPASRELVSRFTGSRNFELVAPVGSEREMVDRMDRGEAAVVLRIPAGFAEDLGGGGTGRVQVVVDGTDSNTAGVILSYVRRIAGAHSSAVLAERIDRRGIRARRPASVELRRRAWFNENLESRNYFVPAVIVIVVTLVTLLLTSMAVVREKEIGTMEQIMVTPIRPVEFIVGKTVPFALIGFADVLLVSGVAVLWFDVPIRGSLLLLLACCGIYLMTTLGIGLLISTMSGTQQQAMLTTFFFFFPMMLLSGFTFPIANMPEPVQWATLLNPMRYFLVLVRAIFQKGSGAAVLWPHMAALAAMGLLTLTFAVRRFKKRTA